MGVCRSSSDYCFYLRNYWGIYSSEVLSNIIIIHSERLNDIVGGTTISGTLINAFTNIIKVLREAGAGVGSSIRRIVDNQICPLE